MTKKKANYSIGETSMSKFTNVEDLFKEIENQYKNRNIFLKIYDFFRYKIKFKLQNFIFEIKNFYHRGKYGFSYSDSYSIYTWFLEIFPKIISHMKNNLSSYPAHDLNDEPNLFNSFSNQVILQENEQIKMWENILERIIYCLHEADEEKCSVKNNYVYKENKKLWKEKEEEIFTYRNNMKNEAFDLIKKYFWDLWD